MSCCVGHRCSSDPSLLWPWCRPVFTAPIRLLAWELLYAMGAALKTTKKNADVCLSFERRMSQEYNTLVLYLTTEEGLVEE